MLTSLHYHLLAKQPWRTKRSNPEMKKTEKSEFVQLNQTLGPLFSGDRVFELAQLKRKLRILT